MAIERGDIKALRNAPIFKSIPTSSREDLLKEVDARTKTLDEGTLLCRAGDSLNYYPVVISGKMQASMPQGGQDRVVCVFGPGESFAEAVPHTLKHSPVNIRAIEPSRLLCIPARSLEHSTNPHAFVLRENLSVEMSKKIGVLSKTLSVVGEPRLTDRVLAYLDTLTPDADGLVTVPLTRGEWATYLRVAEKSLIRELRAMQESGLIEVKGHKVRILGKH